MFFSDSIKKGGRGGEYLLCFFYFPSHHSKMFIGFFMPPLKLETRVFSLMLYINHLNYVNGCIYRVLKAKIYDVALKQFKEIVLSVPKSKLWSSVVKGKNGETATCNEKCESSWAIYHPM
jgi:hypothetical protein